MDRLNKVRMSRLTTALWGVIISVSLLASGTRQASIYASGDEFSVWSVSWKGKATASLQLSYVNPGSPTIHHLDFDLVENRGSNVVKILNRGVQCDEMSVRFIQDDRIMVLNSKDAQKAFSAISPGGLAQALNNLQRIANLQRRYHGPVYTLDMGLLARCTR